MNKVLKILFIFLFSFLLRSANAQTLQGGVEFDWVNLSQNERNELVEEYKDNALNAQGLEFDNTLAKTMARDFQNFETAGKIKAGIEEDENKIMAGFYKGSLLVAYGIIEKNNLKNAYYYNMLGRLFRVDYSEKDYGEYPCATWQYDKKGKLTTKVYNLSKYDQFVYSPEGKFLGRWYNNKLYNQKGKVVMERSWF